MDLSFQQDINQDLQLALSPRLLGMLRILSMPYAEIINEIEKISEENPFIEIEEHEKLTAYLNHLKSDKKLKKQLDFKEYPGFENIDVANKNLIDFLLEQLALIDLENKQNKIAQILINEIDNYGYLKKYDEIKRKICSDYLVEGNVIDELLKIIQTFEPEGVGARNLQECLLIQIREFGFENIKLQEIMEQTIQNHLEDLGNKRFKEISKSLGIEETAVLQIMDFIKNNLNPNPGINFGDETQHVIPSFAAEVENDKVTFINLEEKYGPKISLSSEYQKMLSNPKTDVETINFLKDKLEKAKDFLKDLSKRKETSQAILDIILKVQGEFFKKGAQNLFPLEQKELANKLGLHPSTISRALAGKYMQTKNGVVPLKFLCQREIKGFSPISIKSYIMDIVKQENKTDPLSDEQIKQLLLKDGIQIERRTIAAYRKQLGILSSGERTII